MSTIMFSFNPALIPSIYKEEFMASFLRLVTDYEVMTQPVPPSPPADELPLPEAEGTPLEEMTNQELRDRLADLTGKPHGRKTTVKFPTKAALVEEIRRLQGSDQRTVKLLVTVSGERKMSQDSLDATGDAASVASSGKPRKNPCASYTPEEKAARQAKMAAGREAKKAAAATATAATATAATATAENV